MAVLIILGFSVALLGSFFVAVPTLVGRMSKNVNATRRLSTVSTEVWDPRWDNPPPPYEENDENHHSNDNHLP